MLLPCCYFTSTTSTHELFVLRLCYDVLFKAWKSHKETGCIWTCFLKITKPMFWTMSPHTYLQCAVVIRCHHQIGNFVSFHGITESWKKSSCALSSHEFIIRNSISFCYLSEHSIQAYVNCCHTDFIRNRASFYGVTKTSMNSGRMSDKLTVITSADAAYKTILLHEVLQPGMPRVAGYFYTISFHLQCKPLVGSQELACLWRN